MEDFVAALLAAARRPRERRRLQEKALAIGLAYWPALYVTGCDPEAFVAAEAVLSQRHGLWSPPEAHGGWDSENHYGVSAVTVRAMWFAAGCNADTSKFRAQVRLRMVARKGESCAQFLNRARGQRWLKAWGLAGYFSRQAMRALGKLSPELRHAACRGLDPCRGTTIRARHLNWAEVARIRALRLRTDDVQALEARAAVLPPTAAWEIMGMPSAQDARNMPKSWTETTISVDIVVRDYGFCWAGTIAACRQLELDPAGLYSRLDIYRVYRSEICRGKTLRRHVRNLLERKTS